MSAVVFIPLTQGKVTVIDFEDFEKVRLYKWHAQRVNNHWYARAYTGRENKKSQLTYLHKFLCNGEQDTDHRDGDGLNNQRRNLRACSKSENQRSVRRKKDGATSKFRGVSLCRQTNRWRAQIYYGRRQHVLGRYDNAENAARAYDAAAKEYFGEFASLNFP
jgi:AP2 domain-containing protein